MTVSTKTLTVFAVLTNPLVWVVAALAVVYCLAYAAYVYCKHELSMPEGRVRFQPPVVVEPQCLSCGVALPGDDCQVCGAKEKATVKPGDEWPTSRTPVVVSTAPVPLLNLTELAKEGTEQMGRVASQPQETAARSATSTVAKTPRKRGTKRAPTKKNVAAKVAKKPRN